MDSVQYFHRLGLIPLSADRDGQHDYKLLRGHRPRRLALLVLQLIELSCFSFFFFAAGL